MVRVVITKGGANISRTYWTRLLWVSEDLSVSCCQLWSIAERWWQQALRVSAGCLCFPGLLQVVKFRVLWMGGRVGSGVGLGTGLVVGFEVGLLVITGGIYGVFGGHLVPPTSGIQLLCPPSPFEMVPFPFGTWIGPEGSIMTFGISEIVKRFKLVYNRLPLKVCGIKLWKTHSSTSCQRGLLFTFRIFLYHKSCSFPNNNYVCVCMIYIYPNTHISILRIYAKIMLVFL